MGDYALKDNTILLSCVPIACFMDTGSIIFNTAFKYMGGPKNGTGPDRGEEWNTCPIAMRCCPVCGVNLPAGLHVCRSCSKPIHYPDGIFYADLKDMFSVEYDGIHAKWFYDSMILSAPMIWAEYCPHSTNMLRSSSCGISGRHDRSPKITKDCILRSQCDPVRIRRDHSSRG